MGRIYDKGRESKLEQFWNCVRYEVEYKGAWAWSVGRELLAHGSNSDDVSSESSLVASRVAAFLQARHLALPRGWAFGLHSGVARSRTDAARRLEWLTHSVRPSIMLLVGMGKLEETLTALGLSFSTEKFLPKPNMVQSGGARYEC